MHSSTSCLSHVLVVDDDLLTREVLALVLGAEGYRVTTADDGRAALDQLRHGDHPDLIVLDLMMPGMDGWRFREEQLGDARLADIPVIVCSASRRLGPRAATLHATAYLDKPVEPTELVALVRRSFGRMRAEG
jgi:CheY-like chemotaxis protein